MAYKISLITPVYNAENTLPSALESVKNQTIGFDNIEYILVDDCSRDGSAALIDSYAAQYENVTAWHMRENSGTAGAPRNAALDIASASYVMFLDNDDKLFPNACRALYEAAETSGADIVSGLRGEDDESARGRRSMKNLLGGEKQRLFSGTEFEELASPDLLDVFCGDFWCKIYRRELIEKNCLRFPEGLMFEDKSFLALYLTQCSKALLIDEDIIDYTLRESSLSHIQGLFFYTTIPASIMFCAEKARSLGEERRYAKIIERSRCIEWYCECLARDEAFSRHELERIVAAWAPALCFAAQNGFDYDAPEARLLTNALISGGEEAALYELFNLREMCSRLSAKKEGEKADIKAHYERQLEDIFSSRTWKLARAAQKLLKGE